LWDFFVTGKLLLLISIAIGILNLIQQAMNRKARQVIRQEDAKSLRPFASSLWPLRCKKMNRITEYKRVRRNKRKIVVMQPGTKTKKSLAQKLFLLIP
jgi:hypothetical protein